ncbi:hypothetical protein COLO4_34675 [Corchorus olitorius]|uniref:Uncharacterized protein n=1 Tax=Corchorus olitorius TaxID=93759 RepID=A0A1R3GK20_9ROSI|nr:hypothetical protein COLO4_34675 [Corchorus olitorius]
MESGTSTHIPTATPKIVPLRAKPHSIKKAQAGK